MSFGAIADDYDRLRPGPPDAAVDWLLPTHAQAVIDLGAGTGLLSRALARNVRRECRTARVIAVEPDARMAAVLRARSPGIRALRGTGEAIPLPDGYADGVFVSSAWHWMAPARASVEIARVLRDSGRLGLIWTSRDPESGWFRESRWFNRSEWFGLPARREITLPAGLFGPAEITSFAFTRSETIGDVVGLLGTYSHVITASPQDREAGLARARHALEQRFPGAHEVEVPMRSWCWRADRIVCAVSG
jgi:SAM-dependent methyltransferase